MIYCVLNAGIFILLYSIKNIFAENSIFEKNIVIVLKKVWSSIKHVEQLNGTSY